jgi:hypothetical protein
MAKFELGKSLAKTGDFIGKNKKPLLYVGGAIAVVVIGYAVVKKLKGGIIGESIKGGKFVEQDIDETKTTITDAQAKNYAENLFQAFNYTFGTDKSVIDGVFSKLNPEDFKKVYNAYGKRSYSALTGGTPSPLTFFWNMENIDLISWLNYELGFGDGALKTKIRKVVEPAGFVLEK